MFNLFLKKAINYFSDEEKEKIRAAIHDAEKSTTGEVRLFVEHYCKRNQAVERAAEVFHSMKMDETVDHNGVLIYIALSHKRMAIYADAGIYSKVENGFWDELLHKMQGHFKHAKFAEGVIAVIHDIGKKLAEYFPDGSLQKNEKPDELVFGKK